MAMLWSRLVGRLASRVRSSSRSQQATFTAIYSGNAWGDAESVSGTGSSQARARDFQDELVAMLDAWNVRSILDAPCGDFNWMRHALAERDIAYCGVDIVEDMVCRNREAFGAGNRCFLHRDMTRADLPFADLIICRDGLVHLSFADARAAVRNFRRSGSRYLLATTFLDRALNTDARTGAWRPLNMEAPPFAFPRPLAVIDEHCLHSGGIYRDKRLALWELATLER